MNPEELSNHKAITLTGTQPGMLLRYRFGFIYVKSESAPGQHPLERERLYPDVATALRSLGVSSDCCIPAQRLPEPRYRIITTRDGYSRRTVPCHTYIGACMHLARVEWQLRLDQGLLLLFHSTIEDMQTGLIEPARLMGDLAPTKDVVFEVPASDGRPTYVMMLPEGAAAIWLGGPAKEEWWSDPQLMLHRYGIGGWPTAAESHNLPEYALVKADHRERLVVADHYHSVLHAGRVTCWLRRETGIQCLVDDGHDVQGFDDTIMSGDMIRLTSDTLETYTAQAKGGLVALALRQACEAAPLLSKLAADPTTN